MRATREQEWLDRATAVAAGLSLGTVPMLWSSLLTLGPLDLRPAHAAGLVTLALVLHPRSSAALRSRAVLGLGAIGVLTVLGAAANAIVHVDTYWPTSEVVRMVANLVIAVAVTSAIPHDDPTGLRRMGWATSAGLAWSLAGWLGAIARTAEGLDGATQALLEGRNHHLLFGIQLPAMRSLFHDDIILGTRHGVVFGFLVSGALLHLFAGALEDRWLRATARALTAVVVFTTVLSSSRSGLAALTIALATYSVSRRATLLRLGRTWVAAAIGAVVAGTSLASGVLTRFTEDTASFQSRQGDASVVLGADWSLAGLPTLGADVNSPHNSFIEMAAGGGILALLAALLVAAISLAALWPRHTTGLTIYVLTAAVLVRAVTAARGSLDTAALIAFAVVLISIPSPSYRRSTDHVRAWAPPLALARGER